MPEAKSAATGFPSRNEETPKALKEPHVPDALPLLADESAYVIPRSAQSQDLRVEVVELWGGSGTLDPGEITTVEFYWDDEAKPVDTRTVMAPYGSEIIPFFGFIPALKLGVSGPHQVRYVVELVSGNPTELSHPISVNIDKEGPNQAQPWVKLKFPAEVERDGVTDAYLAVNGDRVVATVEHWSDIRLEDVVEAYWERLPFRDLDPVASVEIEQMHKDGAPVELIFEGEDIRRNGNGEFTAYYHLIDRAGNTGLRSDRALVRVNLTASPITLPAPRVPQADDGLVDLEDARSPGGVYMLIDRVLDLEDGDVISPFWNMIPLPVIVFDASLTWPQRVAIDWSILSAGGFEVTPGTVLARYTWRRGIGTARPSDPRFVPVDLTVAGPVNPGNPDPINNRLEQVTIKGVTGDNIITGADAGRPVRAVVPLYADPRPGQELELMWAAHPTPVDTHTVQTGEREGDEVEFFIPWAIVEPVGNAVVQAYYWTFNGVNRQRAPDTPINVNVIPIIGLARPEFPDVTYDGGPSSGFINCSHLPWLGVRVRIPGDPVRLAMGDKIELSWVGHAGATNNAPVIPETVEVFPHTLTAEEALNGYIFVVPFDPYVKLPGLIKPAEGSDSPRNGCAVVGYRLIKAQGGVGKSGERLLPISLIRVNQPPCLGED
ncbi:hypothetical protein AWM79_04390 [Pseudomonas agarici]|uniref:Uncharacterized protein n=1 Tax=Pseudomonas agarici TaxID=46677 RepID=A0A0X1SXL1_PSEAA|nr:hypothetical protein [Pseudomonas agarici]AMB84591.1 hypothetical protein AWM79_04390 [Pseudomonas agarici]NWB89790.1 hypothetical protein [Pseudomonas agarici]NWC09680.1 hypothetical protein [Pseudomonas agarici]SEK18016.1 hypothetical protein SAMN05216604_1014 [Pseudomonas agarici]